jgi:hypothetical protein
VGPTGHNAKAGARGASPLCQRGVKFFSMYTALSTSPR